MWLLPSWGIHRKWVFVTTYSNSLINYTKLTSVDRSHLTQQNKKGGFLLKVHNKYILIYALYTNSSNSKYPEKLINVIERYNLWKYDGSKKQKTKIKNKKKINDDSNYTVKKGDTLYSISKKHKIIMSGYCKVLYYRFCF